MGCLRFLIGAALLVSFAVGEDSHQALRRIYHGSPKHLGLRDVSPSPELFKPNDTVEFDYGNPEIENRSVYTTTFWHEDLHYVNLEAIEDYLKPQHRLCSRPDRKDSNATTLTLPFENKESYELAKRFWQRDDLVFAIEDPSCMEGAHERSLYRPFAINFSDETLTVVLPRAKPVRSTGDGYDKEFASRVRIVLDSVPEGVSHVVPTRKLVPRSFWSGLRDKCRWFGHLIKKLFKQLDIHKDGRILLHDTSIDLGDKDYGEKHVLYHPRKHFTLGPNITCLNCRHHGEFTLSFGIDVDLRSNAPEWSYSNDKTQDFMRRHLKELWMEVKVTKDINVQLQLDIAGNVGADYNCGISLWPDTGARFGCAPAVVVSGQFVQNARKQTTEEDIAKAAALAESRKAGKPDPEPEKDKKGKPKVPPRPPMFSRHGYHVMPIDFYALQLGGGFGMGGLVNFTTPGFSLKVPQGQSFRYNYFHDTKEPLLQSSIDSEIEILPKVFSVTNHDLHAYVFIGPNFAINLDLPKQKGLQIGVKMDLIKLSMKVSEVASVDEQCKPTNPTTDRKSVAVYLDILSGPQAWMDILGWFVTTDWVAGNEGDWRQGLQFIWHAFKQCCHIGNKAGTWGPNEIVNTGYKYTWNKVLNTGVYAINAMLDVKGQKVRKAQWSKVQKQQEPSEPMKTPDPELLDAE